MHVLYWIVTLIVLIVVSAGLWWVFSSLFGRGEELGPAERPDERKDLEPGATVGPDELSTMRFSLSFRGYSPREVDMALQRAKEHMIELEHDRDRYRRRADDAEEQLKASGAGTASRSSNDAGAAEGTANTGSAPVELQPDEAQSTNGAAAAAEYGETSHSGDTHADDHHRNSAHQHSTHQHSAKTNRAQGKRKKKRKKSKRR